MERFHDANDQYIQELQKASSSKNTQRSTNTWYNVLSSWMRVRNMKEDLLSYKPEELNSLLERFYAEVKKSDGKDYEPDCLRVMMSGIDRYIYLN